FGAIPESLPEAGERRLGTVGSNVGGPLTQLGGQLEENRGLPHLARPGHELDASGRGLGQTAAEGLPTAGVVEMGQIARHGRIIIRLYPEHQTGCESTRRYRCARRRLARPSRDSTCRRKLPK